MSQFNGSVFGQQQRTGNLRLFEMSAEEPSYPAGDKADDKSLPLIARLQMVDERFTLGFFWRPNGETAKHRADSRTGCADRTDICSDYPPDLRRWVIDAPWTQS